jgi:hypothetical protein
LPGGKSVAEKFCGWFQRFASGNAAVIEAKRIADNLDLTWTASVGPILLLPISFGAGQRDPITI